MSPFSHAWVGAGIAYAGWNLGFRFDESPTTMMILGAALGNAPDIDTVLFVPLISKAERRKRPYLDHRGLTHSLWLLPVWGLLVLVLGGGYFSLPAFVLGCLASASHLLLDMVDGSNGVMLFAGNSNGYFRLPFSLVRDLDVLTAGDCVAPPVTAENVFVRVCQETCATLLLSSPLFL